MSPSEFLNSIKAPTMFIVNCSVHRQVEVWIDGALPLSRPIDSILSRDELNAQWPSLNQNQRTMETGWTNAREKASCWSCIEDRTARFIPFCQTASRLVDLGDLFAGIEPEELADHLAIECACRPLPETQRIIRPDDGLGFRLADPANAVVKIPFLKFTVTFPDVPLYTSGVTGMCLDCRTLYYVHF